MRDNDLFILLRGYLIREFPQYGLAGIAVKQSYQPTQQGRPSEGAVFLHKITDKRYGHRGVTHNLNVHDKASGLLQREETQVMETTIQFSALAAPQNPADDDELTAADILKTVASLLQSVDFIETARKSGVQVLRVMDIRNTYVSNERDQFELEPSFDAVFTHNDFYRRLVPSLSRVVGEGVRANDDSNNSNNNGAHGEGIYGV